MDRNTFLQRMMRFGIFMKGIIYIVIGVLTSLAALNLGGNETGKSEALQSIYSQPFGQVLLGLVALGLMCYVAWRFVQAIKDPENIGNDWKGIGTRIGYASSGAVYIAVAYQALSLLMRAGSSNGNGRAELVGTILGWPLGQYIVIGIAVGFMGKAIYQFHRGWSGRYEKKVKSNQLNVNGKKVVKISGFIGYNARGIVISIIAWFFLQAALNWDPNQADGSEGAFNFIRQMDYGNYLLFIVAAGLACYGVFNVIKARYRSLPSLD